MGRGVRARPAPGRRSLGGANCRWTQPLSRPQPPEAVAEGQPLQGLGPSTTIGGRVYASLRLGRSPDLTRGSEGWREAERVRRGAVGYALLVWIFDGLAPDYDVRGREGDHGFGEARIRGELYRGRQDHRATALYSVGLATRTMMHSCASAAKFLGGGTILSLGATAMARCGSRRLGSLPARAKARSPRERNSSSGKVWGSRGVFRARAFDVPAQPTGSNSTTPAGTTPSSTKRQRSISSLRAIATIIVLRTPRGPSTVRASNHLANALSFWNIRNRQASWIMPRRTRPLPARASPFSRRLEPLSSGDPVKPP